MATELSAAPALSTPAEHLFEHADPESYTSEPAQQLTDNELHDIYEVARTAKEIREGGWKRVALQFPDHMLRDAPRVIQALTSEFQKATEVASQNANGASEQAPAYKPERIYILADTSYSSCCVDEIAAEHVDADVVVHYGRSCLSPTSRLPVIYVFTQHTLDRDAVLADFEKEFPDKDVKAILMADVTYQDHIPELATELRVRGYKNLLSTAIVHDPTGRIPNRKITNVDGKDLVSEEGSVDALDLRDYSIFHISDPPTALLLALSSRVKNLHIFPTSSTGSSGQSYSTQRLLGRRYARCLSLASAGIIGILVNTLSVSNYLASIDSIRKQIAAKGKKSYTVVVGKLNPAKLANFAEVDGWVVIGCWESSLVEDDAGFYRPVITPFELELALASDDERVWTGEWWGGIEGVKPPAEDDPVSKKEDEKDAEVKGSKQEEGTPVVPTKEQEADQWEVDEEESAPPEFDLRTGKLVSHSRPMRAAINREQNGGTTSNDHSSSNANTQSSSALALRSKSSQLATVNGVISPGAEYLRSQRTWTGLGADFTEDASTEIEEGRSGVARGYTVGEDAARR